MKILYSWLKEFYPIKESPEKLAELLSFSSFETLVDKKSGGDAVLEVALLPNRVADAASHFGVAREIALLKNQRLNISVKAPRESAQKIQSFAKIEVRAPKLVKRYCARAVWGVKVKESPVWMKKRLLACGLRPINNIVDAMNYVMLEIGQPLHAFDADEIKDRKIIVRSARKGETIETIERKNYALSGSELLIADHAGPLAFAGIKGGRRGEISKKTKDIIIESANFDPVQTRLTAKKHNLKTDASWRFENGFDPNLALDGVNRVSALIQQVAGGDVLRGVLDFYPKKVLPRPVVVSIKDISRLLGANLNETKVVKIVSPFCESIKRLGQGKLLLKVQTHRQDIGYPEDVAEEVARVIGYNAIQSQSPIAPLTVPRRNESLEFCELLRGHLTALGFSETYNYVFVGERDVERLGLDRAELVEVVNPLSNETRFLRRDLFLNLLKNVAGNLRFFDEVKIFEIGKQYRWRNGKLHEVWRLAGVLARKKAAPKELFLEIKGMIEALFERLGLDRDDYRIREPGHDKHLLSGAVASVFLDSADVVKFGVVQPRLLHTYEIGDSVVYWRVEIDELQKAVQEEHEFEPFHKYPDVVRDISMVVPAERRIEEVQNVIHAASPKHLEDIDLFDIYEGEDLGEARKSLAFHLLFRSDDHTLTDEEVGKELQKIVKALLGFGVEIR